MVHELKEAQSPWFEYFTQCQQALEQADAEYIWCCQTVWNEMHL